MARSVYGVLWAAFCLLIFLPATTANCPSGQALVRVVTPPTTTTTTTTTSTTTTNTTTTTTTSTTATSTDNATTTTSTNITISNDDTTTTPGTNATATSKPTTTTTTRKPTTTTTTTNRTTTTTGVRRLFEDGSVDNDGLDDGLSRRLSEPISESRCSLIPDVCYQEQDWLPDKVVRVSCADDEWPHVRNMTHFSECSCQRGNIYHDAVHEMTNPYECVIDAMQAPTGTPYTSWCNGFNVPVRRDYTCQELAVKYLPQLLNLNSPRPVASDAYCDSMYNRSQDEQEPIHEFQWWMLQMGCCGTPAGYSALTACDRVSHPDLQADSFQVNICEDATDFTPDSHWEVDCMGITEAQCLSLHGSVSSSGDCNGRPPCNLGGFSGNDPAGVCTSVGGTVIRGLTCRTVMDRYVLPHFNSFDSLGHWEKSICLEQVSDYTGSSGGQIVQDRVRVAGLRCCRNMQTVCPRVHGIMLYGDATSTCQMTDFGDFATTTFYVLPQYAWNYGQCAPVNRSSVGTLDPLDRPPETVYFRAECSVNYTLEVKIYVDDRCRSQVNRIMLNPGQTTELLDGNCAQATFDSSTVQLKFTPVQVPYFPFCGATDTCTCDPPELKSGSGAAQEFSGFVNVQSYGCSGSRHYVELQQALDDCRSSSDCAGVQNMGCNMEVSDGVYTLCSTGSMFCCQDDCAYVKAATPTMAPPPTKSLPGGGA